ncbi:MBL fold metallo-hydrolase [Thermogutta sp.]|uniref:MBL fold metallo-hydrolase n=1 Tax=Thermogutta sp. TaxID=1962930 RepID=UPI003C7A9680
MEQRDPKVITIVSAMFGQNCYIVYRDNRSDCVVIDPGLDWGKIIRNIVNLGLAPAAILITHGHADHIAGVEAVKERWPATEIVVGKRDADKLTDSHLNLSADFGFPLATPPADKLVEDGQILEYAGMRILVREVPGHSEGHVIYLLNDTTPPLAFVGDVIFAGSIGRTDFPGGDFELLEEGIRSKIYSLPSETQLWSGHGPPTTVEREKTHNPFVRG